MRDIAVNRQARFKYELLEKWEAGLVLVGSEVKSLRDGKADLKDCYVTIEDGEAWVVGMHIAPYSHASEGHEPGRRRKLLLKKNEIDRILGKTQKSSLTVVPTRAYFKGGRAKLEIALARGKTQHDKRQTIKERESKREMERALKGRVRD